MIDRFLADVFAKKIKKNLDEDDLRKIERALFITDGMSLKMAVEHFDKLHLQIKQVKNHPELFELEILDEICKIQHSKDQAIIHIRDNSLSNEIVNYLGDEEIRYILLLVMKNELTVQEILKHSKISKTSGYRKIENLIRDGIIVEERKVLSKSKKISKYKCIFEEIIFRLNNNKFLVEAYMKRKDFEKSSIMKILEEY